MMIIITMVTDGHDQVKTIRVDDRNIAIQLWDTAGQLILSQSKKYVFSFLDTQVSLAPTHVRL